MNIFVSGATGFIGTKLAIKLAEMGHLVHALYRNPDKLKSLQHPNIKPFKGDVLDVNSLSKAMEGCEQVYHIAAFTEVWAESEQLIYDLNVKATENVLELALKFKVKKMVFTSTAGVLGPSENFEFVYEYSKRTTDFFLEYERTKAIAEDKVKEFVKKGVNCVIVNPTRVYGPGLLSKSNSVTMMIKSYSEGKWRIIPGNGKSIGNYVFIDDVLKGHLLAMENGIPGERYILGGVNLSYLDFFKILSQLTGKKRLMIKLPLFMMLNVAHIMMLMSKLFGTKPLITPQLVRKFNFNWIVSSEKAIVDLGYLPLIFEEGAKLTMEWIKSMKSDK